MVERVKVTFEMNVDVDYLAEQVAALTDDAQAQLLCKVAAKLGEAVEMQAVYIGRHLSNCSCSTDIGRQFVRDIYETMREEDLRVREDHQGPQP